MPERNNEVMICANGAMSNDVIGVSSRGGRGKYVVSRNVCSLVGSRDDDDEEEETEAAVELLDGSNAIAVFAVTDGGGDGTGAVANATIRCKLFNCVDKSEGGDGVTVVASTIDLPSLSCPSPSSPLMGMNVSTPVYPGPFPPAPSPP